MNKATALTTLAVFLVIFSATAALAVPEIVQNEAKKQVEGVKKKIADKTKLVCRIYDAETGGTLIASLEAKNSWKVAALVASLPKTIGKEYWLETQIGSPRQKLWPKLPTEQPAKTPAETPASSDLPATDTANAASAAGDAASSASSAVSGGLNLLGGAAGVAGAAANVQSLPSTAAINAGASALGAVAGAAGAAGGAGKEENVLTTETMGTAAVTPEGTSEAVATIETVSLLPVIEYIKIDNILVQTKSTNYVEPTAISTTPTISCKIRSPQDPDIKVSLVTNKGTSHEKTFVIGPKSIHTVAAGPNEVALLISYGLPESDSLPGGANSIELIAINAVGSTSESFTAIVVNSLDEIMEVPESR